MGTRLLLYLGILMIGALIGYKGLGGEKLHNKLSIIQTACLLFLLLVMGIRMGLDDKVINSFFELGYQAIILSIFSIAFSVILVLAVRRFVFKNSRKEEMTDES